MAVLPVFSTPALVQLFEQTCNSASKDLLPTGTTHGGFEFIIRHLRLVPVGGKVEALAEVAELQGNKIADGSYSCAIVPSRFGEGLSASSTVVDQGAGH